MPSKQRILITVMTYPHPSKGYQELVCTAGINENKEWVRLYPVDYRYRERNQQFRKYQWIEADLQKADPKKDNRPETYRPNLESIKILGEPLSTKNEWRERRDFIDAMPHHTGACYATSFSATSESRQPGGLGVLREVFHGFSEEARTRGFPSPSLGGFGFFGCN